MGRTRQKSFDDASNDGYLGVSEVAARLSLSTRTIRNYVRDVEDPLPGYRVGGKLLFKWAEVESWIASRRIEPVDVDRIVSEIAAKVRGE